MKSKNERYTAAVIGAGSGGLTVAIGLAGLGKQVLMIEAADVGGDCTNVGCIPSKALIHLVAGGDPNPFAAVRAKRDHLRDEETEEFSDTENIKLVFGRARLTSASSVEVTATDGSVDRYEVDNVVLATGSTARMIDIPGLPADQLLTNANLWDLDEPPAHLAIVGAGPIGIEMASAFRQMGSEVTVVDMAERVLPGEDPEVSEIVATALSDQGITVRSGVATSGFKAGGRLDLDDGSSIEGVDRVLLAIGQIPRIDDLGLEALGVEVTRRGIPTNSWGATNIKGVWAVGDVTGMTHSTHGANSMGRRIGQAIGLPAIPRIGGPPSVPVGVFGQPQVASVGMSIAELHADYPDDRRIHLRADLADTDRGFTDEVVHGAVIVDAERLTGKILRASIVGPGAADMIGIFTLAIDQDISLHKVFRMVHPYPTYTWAIGMIADEFLRQTFPNITTETRRWFKYLPIRLRTRFSR